MDYPQSQGARAIGARLRRLSDAIDADAARAYSVLGVRFEQRWFGVMNQLLEREAATVGQLAEALGITHVSVSQTRQSLEKAGLVTAEADPSDARKRRLRLTAEGRDMAARLRPLWRAFDAAAEEVDADAGGIVARLSELEKALKQASMFERIMVHLDKAGDR
ncbi:MarR family winged helix-turn-helix transcriptional regulator [Parasphingopyxis lamellibrachiae]|uniref:MarR family protein n=1 Tax=Parasphingopyxis lamellibrachiae TaxID=680125 RepID=A0A3D9FC24_9SPHN|nr:MarR family transcriptional regulator [Parasphingopyxis lamellibrachiae]RED15117.1 MarR family protein [Parasphingopyxis lamellibrachiae]